MDLTHRPSECSGSLTPQLEGAASSAPHPDRDKTEQRKPEAERKQSET